MPRHVGGVMTWCEGTLHDASIQTLTCADRARFSLQAEIGTEIVQQAMLGPELCPRNLAITVNVKLPVQAQRASPDGGSVAAQVA